MKHPSLVTFLLSGVFSSVLQAGITFGPVKGKQGEIVRMVSHSETPGGSIRIQSKGVDTTGVIRMTREIMDQQKRVNDTIKKAGGGK